MPPTTKAIEVPAESWVATFSGWKMTNPIKGLKDVEYVAPGRFQVKIERLGGRRKELRVFTPYVKMNGAWKAFDKQVEPAESPDFMKVMTEYVFQKQETAWERRP